MQPLFTLMGLFAPLSAKKAGIIRRQSSKFTAAGFRFFLSFSLSLHPGSIITAAL